MSSKTRFQNSTFKVRTHRILSYRCSVSVASDYLNHFSSPNNDVFSESSSIVGVSNFSTSSANNMYWNAMVSPEKTGLIDFYDSLNMYVGETEGEEEVFEDDE